MERAKTEVEKKVSKLLKFIQTKNKIPKESKRDLLAIVTDLQEQCQYLYSTFDHFHQDLDHPSSSRKEKSEKSSSDLDYYSSEEVENVVEEGNEITELRSKLEVLRNEAEVKEQELSSRVKELEQELGDAKAECDRKGALEQEIAMKASESMQLGEKNKGLRSQISGLNLVLKEKGDEISTLVNKFGNSELGLTSRIEELKSQLKNLEQEISFLRARNAELVEGKKVEEKDYVRGLMDQVNGMRHEIVSLRNEKDEFQFKFEKKVEEVTETKMQLKSVEEVTEEQRKNLKEEIDYIRGENQKLHSRIAELDSLRKEIDTKNVEQIDENKKLNEEIGHLRGENQKLHSRIAELDMLHKKIEMKNVEEIENENKKMDVQVSDQKKLVKDKDDIIHRLSAKIKDQQRLLEEQKESIDKYSDDENKKLDIQVSDQKKLVKDKDDVIRKLSAKIKDQQRLIAEQKETIDKYSDDMKLMKRGSFGSLRETKLNPIAIERKMEEIAEKFRKNIEDHIRILYRRIHVAEQIHAESKDHYNKAREAAREIKENKESLVFFEKHFKKIKGVWEEGYERSIKKLQEAEEHTDKVAIFAKEIDKAKIWVREKRSELETLTAKLECSEAQESLLKEKLSKLEQKLAEEGKEKLTLAKVLSRFEGKVKDLEGKAKGREVEILSLGEEKREAIRQLCIIVDYQRDRYNELKKSSLKVSHKS